MGQTVNAIEELQKASVLRPNNVDVHYNLAVAYAIIERKLEALKEFKSALSIDPQHEPSLNGLRKLMQYFFPGRFRTYWAL